MSDEEMVPCPTCKGEGQYEVYACPGFRRTLVKCGRCKSSGEITGAEAFRMAEGQRRRGDRLRRGLSLQQEAKRLGLTPMQLADIEHAR